MRAVPFQLTANLASAALHDQLSSMVLPLINVSSYALGRLAPGRCWKTRLGASMSVRITLIYASLIVVLVSFVAFISGPLWGLRLDYEKGQQIQLIQIIIPTFISYLSTAIVYAGLGKAVPEPQGQRGQILRTINLGVLVIFAAGVIVATAMYYVSANGTLQYGRLNFERYSMIITMLLGLLAATTSAISAFLFPVVR